MPASADTVLRLRRALPLTESVRPRVLGVDDWALKKGQTYGTILVDLEARRVTDLLPDRTAETVAEWLKVHSPIEAIARDRFTEYARGAAVGAPAAVQVADRWHRLQNLRQMVERWLADIHGRLWGRPPVPGEDAAPTRRTRACRRSRAEAAATADFRARRMAQYEEVQRRFSGGETLLAISRAMGLARGTVQRCASAQSFPERAARVPEPSILDPYLDHLEARLAEGRENASVMWRDLNELGCAGSAKQVRRWLNERRTAPAKTTPHKRRSDQSRTASDPVHGPALLSPRQLAWLLVQSPEALEASATATLARIAQDPEVGGALALVRLFAELVRDCGIHRDKAPANPLAVFGTWLEEARSCGIPAVATGLQQDGAVVWTSVIRLGVSASHVSVR